MPYIPSDRRDDLESGDPPVTLGELTYMLTNVLLRYYRAQPTKDYALHAQLLGALATCQHEWYRRMAGPYEEMRMVVHGDVYPPVSWL